jgi:anaerobic ribonucleoside-triphosphate reductase activating protein
MPGALLNIAHTIPRSTVNGPGERFVLWVQGCTLACPGCWNPDTWSRAPRTTVHPLDLAGTIVATAGIEGVTLTGGEPFEQAAQLVPLVSHVRAAGLSVMTFTGFELDELETKAQRGLLAACDIVVSGRYRQRARSSDLAWRGSSNQTVHFRTGRYGPEVLPDTSGCEIHLADDGSLALTGFPPSALAGLAERRPDRPRRGGRRGMSDLNTVPDDEPEGDAEPGDPPPDRAAHG